MGHIYIYYYSNNILKFPLFVVSVLIYLIIVYSSRKIFALFEYFLAKYRREMHWPIYIETGYKYDFVLLVMASIGISLHRREKFSFLFMGKKKTRS